MRAHLISLLLAILTREGVVHRLDPRDGQQKSTEAASGATAMAIFDDGRVALLAGARLTVAGRALPGKFADLRQLAAGVSLWGATDGAVVQLDVKSGARATLLQLPRLHRLAADGASLFAEADGVIVEVGSARRWTVAGQPVALTAGDGKLWVATKQGPLWEIDRKSGAQRELGLGDWWGAVALAYADHAVYAVTVAGKLWRIDPVKREKTIVAMDGWQGAIDLSVLR